LYPEDYDTAAGDSYPSRHDAPIAPRYPTAFYSRTWFDPAGAGTSPYNAVVDLRAGNAAGLTLCLDSYRVMVLGDAYVPAGAGAQTLYWVWADAGDTIRNYYQMGAIYLPGAAPASPEPLVWDSGWVALTPGSLIGGTPTHPARHLGFRLDQDWVGTVHFTVHFHVEQLAGA